jgi:hypothetical protein
LRPDSFEVRFRQMADRYLPDALFDNLYSAHKPLKNRDFSTACEGSSEILPVQHAMLPKGAP